MVGHGTRSPGGWRRTRRSGKIRCGYPASEPSQTDTVVEQHLQELVERARSGDDEPFAELLRALRQAAPQADFLLDYARSDEAVLRRAAVVLGKDLAEPELLEALADLAGDFDEGVRLTLADAAREAVWWPPDAVVSQLLRDPNSEVRLAAVRAAGRRPALEPGLVARLTEDDSWRVRQEAARLLGDGTPRAVLPTLLTVLAEDSDGDVQRECAASAER